MASDMEVLLRHAAIGQYSNGRLVLKIQGQVMGALRAQYTATILKTHNNSQQRAGRKTLFSYVVNRCKFCF